MTRWLSAALLFCTAPAFAVGFQPDLRTLSAVPQFVLPPAEVQKALAQAPRKNRPFQYAVGIGTGISATDGRWETLDAQTLGWRLRIASAGAKSMSLHFAPFELPAGASVWIYTPDGKLLHGPYTSAHATPQGLWTPIIPGEEAVVEARVAVADAGRFKLGIAHAYHGYRDWKAADAAGVIEKESSSPALAPGAAPAKSGACNIDVACSQADPWDNEVRSVARIQIAGTSLCSGQLLNNVRQDQTPLFLTAGHCGISAEGSSPASSVVFYFNYQAAICGGPRSDPNLADTRSGATFLADDIQSDFTLLRINQPIPTTYNVYFSGWNAAGQGSPSGASIHHPSGDDKAISFYSDAVSQTSVNIGAACPIDAWQVQWSSGTTEQGSSGGGLWNSAHRLIGALSGGSASCGNPNGVDYFGRFDRAWTASPSPQGQLKAHLDPDNTCIADVPGLDSSNVSATPITDGPRICQGPVSTCGANGGGGGGGLPLSVLLVLAASTLLRMTRSGFKTPA